MKPETMPQAEYDKRMAAAKKLMEDDPESAPYVKLMPIMIEVVAGAGVLWEKMVAAGATHDEMESLQQAHGQACFPVRDPWKTADALFVRWSNGRAPTPGRQFGAALLEGPREAIADLPPGGLRIVRVTEVEVVNDEATLLCDFCGEPPRLAESGFAANPIKRYDDGDAFTSPFHAGCHTEWAEQQARRKALGIEPVTVEEAKERFVDAITPREPVPAPSAADVKAFGERFEAAAHRPVLEAKGADCDCRGACACHYGAEPKAAEAGCLEDPRSGCGTGNPPSKPAASPRPPMAMGPPLSEEEALASVESALERLFPVHDLRLVLSASDEVREAVCAAYRRKGFEAKPIPQGIWLNQDEDGKAAQAELDEDDKRRRGERAAEERRRKFLCDEETRS